MRTESEIRSEIEILRKKLNEEMALNLNRVPGYDVMRVSREMDMLLNELNEVLGVGKNKVL